MAWPGTDPQGIAAERIRDNALITANTAAIAAWTGDSNGLRDLQMKNSETSFRLNTMSTTVGIGAKLGFDSAFAYSGFGLELVST